ncbi:unnamed protein product [Mytilus coruscus]|uniref:Uncharacterized protein n=1 Tax=Mytilus coruscus TaxID=42192 RepID=A0A6J8C9E2_MYTCO|nr:unnamed protein product [Mytilus coruscus]
MPPMIDFIDKVVGDREGDGNVHQSKNHLCRETLFWFFGFFLQIIGIICISIYIKIDWLIGMFILSAAFTSIKYWENFVAMKENSSKFLRKVKWELHKGRTKVACLVSLWKMVVTIITVLSIFSIQGHDFTSALTSRFNNTGVSNLTTAFGDQEFGNIPICNNKAPFIVAVISISCDYLCYKASKTVCVINCQRFGFSIPLIVVPMLTTLTLIGLMFKPEFLKFSSCDFLFSTWCITDIDQLFQNCFELCIAFLSLVPSILLITRHIWKVNGFKHGETAR